MVARRNIEPLEIHIDADSVAGRQLAGANGRPIRLVSNGTRYRVEPDPPERAEAAGGRVEPVTAEAAAPNDPWANYDGERAATAIRALAAANILGGVDIEELKRELKEQRGQRSMGRPEW